MINRLGKFSFNPAELVPLFFVLRILAVCIGVFLLLDRLGTDDQVGVPNGSDKQTKSGQ